MANQIAERIRREIERDQQRMADEMRIQLAADLVARDGYVAIAPVAKLCEERPVKASKQHERVGRFYLYRCSGHWATRRIDGTGDERWHTNKKVATEYARRITAREAEAERRQVKGGEGDEQ